MLVTRDDVLKGIIRALSEIGIEIEGAQPSVVEDVIQDSLTIISILVQLENEFNTEIDIEFDSFNTLNSIDGLTDLVCTALSSKSKDVHSNPNIEMKGSDDCEEVD